MIMKKIFSTLLLIMLGMSLFAQFPGGFNYQAVVRNTAGEIIANKTVKFRISMLQESESGTDVYVETHSVVTGAFGLANLKVGMGTKVSGNFDPSAWGLKKHFMKVELDPNNGNTFSALGTTQLLAVPYAFHAKTVEIDKVDDADADPLNEIQILNLSGTVLSLSKGGGSVTLPSSGSGGDHWGTQTVVTDATLTGNGTTASPLKVADSGISTAKIAGSAVTADKLAGNAVTETRIAAGAVTEGKIAAGAVTADKLAGNAVTDEKIATGAVTQGKIATGAVTGAKIAQAGATTGQVMKWNGTTWAPAADETGSGGSNPTGTAGGDLTGTYPNPLIGDGKVTSAKILDGTISALDLGSNAVTNVKIDAGAVTADKLAGNAVTENKISTGAVTDEKIATGAVTQGKIATGAVTGAKIAQAGATTGQVMKWNGTTWAPAADETGSGGSNPTGTAGGDLTGTYPNPLIGDGKITSAKILDGTISALDLGSNAVTNVKIEAGAVTGSKIAQAGATTGQALKWNGTTWAPANDDAGSGGLTLPYSGQITLNPGNTAFSIKSSGSLAIHAEGSQGSIYATYQGTGYHAAVLGAATTSGGYSYGVIGRSHSTAGTAVWAHNQATSGSEATGLMAEIASTSGRAVNVLSTATSGTSYGVYSDVKSADAYSGYFTGGRFSVLSSKVGIGTSSPAYQMDIAGSANLNKGIASGAALHVNGLQALGYYNNVYFAWGHPENHNFFPGRVFIGTTYTSPGTHRLVVTGTAAKDGGGSWATWSDSRLKNIHGKFASGLDVISKLEPVRFSYKKDNPVNLTSDQEYVGFIAQEVQKIIPEAVSAGADGFLNFDMHVVNVTLVNAVKELKNENDQLKSRVGHLEEEKAMMTKRLERLEILMSAQTGK
jgi:hypothetical protein